MDVDRVESEAERLLQKRVLEGGAVALRVRGTDEILDDVTVEEAPTERCRRIVETGAVTVFHIGLEDDPHIALLCDHSHRFDGPRHLLGVVVP